MENPEKLPGYVVQWLSEFAVENDEFENLATAFLYRDIVSGVVFSKATGEMVTR